MGGSSIILRYSALFQGANTPYLAKTIAPHWRRVTTVPIVMTSDYQCPSNYVVRDIQRRGSPAVRGKRQGEGESLETAVKGPRPSISRL